MGCVEKLEFGQLTTAGALTSAVFYLSTPHDSIPFIVFKMLPVLHFNCMLSFQGHSSTPDS